MRLLPTKVLLLPADVLLLPPASEARLTVLAQLTEEELYSRARWRMQPLVEPVCLCAARGGPDQHGAKAAHGAPRTLETRVAALGLNRRAEFRTVCRMGTVSGLALTHPPSPALPFQLRVSLSAHCSSHAPRVDARPDTSPHLNLRKHDTGRSKKTRRQAGFHVVQAATSYADFLRRRARPSSPSPSNARVAGSGTLSSWPRISPPPNCPV